MKIIENITAKGTELCLCLAEETDCRLLETAEALCFASNPWSEKTFRDCLANDGCFIYCLCDTQLSKILTFAVTQTCLDEADLANIATIPEERRKGYGGLLLDKILENARNTGVLRIFLEVRESNVGARRLYLSRGFVEIGKRRNYYRSPCEDAILMLREEK